MATPKDLIPQKYEVLRLRNGVEICGMTRDTGVEVIITLPMICRLMARSPKETVATFYPYAPLTSDYNIKIPRDYVVHRNMMNDQYIPFYDDASSQWMDMIENKSIPLITPQEMAEFDREDFEELLSDVMDEVRHRGDKPETFEDRYDEFVKLLKPKKGQKVH